MYICFICSLDPRNIFDFPINWIKGLGLDTVGEESHKAYLLEFCGRVLDFLKDKILYSMETTTLSLKVMGGLYQEVLWHTHYATSKLKKFFVSYLLNAIHLNIVCTTTGTKKSCFIDYGIH